MKSLASKTSVNHLKIPIEMNHIASKRSSNKTNIACNSKEIHFENHEITQIIANSSKNNMEKAKHISRNLIVKMDENTSKSVSKHSLKLKASNNLIFSTLQNDDSVKNIKEMIKFVIFKIIVPLFFFCSVCVSIIIIQIYVNDFCFYPKICSCQNIFIFTYTMIKEIIHTYAALILVIYYGLTFISKEFQQKISLKVFFVFISFSILLMNFEFEYISKGEGIFSVLFKRNLAALFANYFIFLLILTVFFKKFTKEFFKRIFLSTVLLIYLFSHLFYFKSFAIFYILQYFKVFYTNDLSLNLFKTFLMFYYFIYQYLSKILLLNIYKKKISSDHPGSCNNVIFVMKFISVDVLSVQALNILTISLNEIFSWICLIVYFYSIFSVYSRINIIDYLLKNCYAKVIKKKNHDKIEIEIEIENREFDNLRSGCLFETNLIVFLRIICFKAFHYFILFFNEADLYEDCSLKEAANSFEILDANIILLMSTHTLLLVLMAVCIYGFNQKDILFNYHIEEINFLGRLLLFIICFSYADYTLQIYKALLIM